MREAKNFSSEKNYTCINKPKDGCWMRDECTAVVKEAKILTGP